MISTQELRVQRPRTGQCIITNTPYKCGIHPQNIAIHPNIQEYTRIHTKIRILPEYIPKISELTSNRKSPQYTGIYPREFFCIYQCIQIYQGVFRYFKVYFGAYSGLLFQGVFLYAGNLYVYPDISGCYCIQRYFEGVHVFQILGCIPVISHTTSIQGHPV